MTRMSRRKRIKWISKVTASMAFSALVALRFIESKSDGCWNSSGNRD